MLPTSKERTTNPGYRKPKATKPEMQNPESRKAKKLCHPRLEPLAALARNRQPTGPDPKP